MISNKIDDYKVLSILGSEGDFTYYKVQDKVTGIFYQWQAFNYNMDEDLNNALITEILTRKGLVQKYFLRVFDYIYHTSTKTVYIITEYCNHGSLSKILQNCLKNGQYIDESLIWNILYTISNLIKENLCQIEDITLNNILLSNTNSIQLLSLKFSGENLFNNCSKDEICPIEQLGTIIYKLCTLNCSEKCKFNFDNIPTYYSEELGDIIEFLLHKTDIQPTIDAILYHPTILINLPNCGQENKVYVSKSDHKNIGYEKEVSADKLQRHFRQLKVREVELNIKESKFEEREQQIRRRERKITLAERLAKEKLRRAELYLKSAREQRTEIKNTSLGYNSDILSKCYAVESISTNIYENVSVVKKLSKQKLRSQANLNTHRTNTSNRKIKFKGHSPLKDIKNSPKLSQEINERYCNKKRVSIKVLESADRTNSSNSVTKSGKIGLTSSNSDSRELLQKNTKRNQNTHKIENTSEQQAVAFRKTKTSPKNGVFTDKFAKRNATVRRSFLNIMFNRTTNVKRNCKEGEKNVQQGFGPDLIQNYEEIGDFLEENELKKTEMMGCKALVWTEENKKQAFDMLRVINEEKEDTVVKHTYL